MQWVILDEFKNIVDKEDKPRFLLESEIDFMLSFLPLPLAANLESSLTIRTNLVNILKSEMRTEMLTSGAIEEIRNKIVDTFNKSRLQPGQAAGNTAAQSHGANITQMILNTFHSAGSANSATNSINGLTDILYASRKVKNYVCTTIFEDEYLSYEDVLKTRNKILEVKLDDLIEDFEIDDYENIPRFWWHETNELLFPDRDFTFKPLKVLRIKLNVSELFNSKTTIETLVEIIENNGDQIDNFTIYTSPTNLGTIDIYPNFDKIKDNMNLGIRKNKGEKVVKKVTKSKKIIPLSEEIESEVEDGPIDCCRQVDIEVQYLFKIFLKAIRKIIVKGVPNLRYLRPEVIKLTEFFLIEKKINIDESIIDELKHMSEDDLDNVWVIVLDLNSMNDFGVSENKIKNMFETFGMNIIHTNSNKYYVYFHLMKNDMGDLLFSINRNNYLLILNNDSSNKDQLYGTHYHEDDNGNIYRIIQKSRLEEKNDEFHEKINQNGNVKIHHPSIIKNINGNYFVLLDKDRISRNDENGIIYYLLLNDDVVLSKDFKISSYISNLVDNDKKFLQKLRGDALIQLNMPNVKFEEKIEYIEYLENNNNTLYLKSALHTYAEIGGVSDKNYNTLTILQNLPIVDAYRTLSNNVHEIYKIIGIEGARSYLIKTFSNHLKKNELYVNSSHIILLAEFMTNRPNLDSNGLITGVNGVNYIGISRQPGGPLSLGTMQRASEIIAKHSLFGNIEDIKNLSVSIIVGSRIFIGNGYFDIGQNIIDNDGVEKTLINDDVYNPSLHKNKKVVRYLIENSLEEDLKEIDDNEENFYDDSNITESIFKNAEKSDNMQSDESYLEFEKNLPSYVKTTGITVPENLIIILAAIDLPPVIKEMIDNYNSGEEISSSDEEDEIIISNIEEVPPIVNIYSEENKIINRERKIKIEKIEKSFLPDIEDINEDTESIKNEIQPINVDKFLNQ